MQTYVCRGLNEVLLNTRRGPFSVTSVRHKCSGTLSSEPFDEFLMAGNLIRVRIGRQWLVAGYADAWLSMMPPYLKASWSTRSLSVEIFYLPHPDQTSFFDY